MKNNKLPGIVILMILTLITAVFWTAFSVYRSFTKPSTVVVPEEVIKQINPKLDVETIELIKSKN
jgi:uncharacterized protein YpmB